MEYLMLFLTFAKIGAITFGGGLAMLPILKREIVENKGWATEEELVDYYAIGQCTPGIIAVNTATFIGAKQKGVFGGIVATLGMVFPSIVIITVIAAFLQNFLEFQYVQYAMNGIRICVCVLIFDTVVSLIKKAIVDIPSGVIFLVALVLSAFTNFPIIGIVVLAGICGISVKTVQKMKKKEDKK